MRLVWILLLNEFSRGMQSQWHFYVAVNMLLLRFHSYFFSAHIHAIPQRIGNKDRIVEAKNQRSIIWLWFQCITHQINEKSQLTRKYSLSICCHWRCWVYSARLICATAVLYHHRFIQSDTTQYWLYCRYILHTLLKWKSVITSKRVVTEFEVEIRIVFLLFKCKRFSISHISIVILDAVFLKCFSSMLRNLNCFWNIL